MEHNKLAISILAVLSVAAATSLFVAAPAISGESELPFAIQAHGRSVPAIAQELPTWQQVNSNGFGDLQTGAVNALESFNGYLYAGASNPTAGARIFRTPDGVTWAPVTEPGFGIAHDIAPPAILDLAVFDGQLYATTGRGDGPGQIWRSLDGSLWAPMVIAGFSDPDTVDVTALAVYNGTLYAGAKNLISGAQIWHSYTGDSNTWHQVAPAMPGTAPAGVTGLAEFAGALYAAVESDGPAQIWVSYGGDWTTAVSDGFGDSDTISTGGMAEFAGFLYAGAGNAVSGAQLWRTNDGETWQQVIDPGFGDSNNQKVEMVFVFQNYLYASVSNVQTGLALWRSANGTLWEQANLDGFGDSHNTSVNWSNATVPFQNQLYVGTSNVVDGGELWRMQQPAYGVALSPDQARQGLAGQTVTHNLTVINTGSEAETVDLLPTGNQWTTTLSSQEVTLPAGGSQVVTITVSIPSTAAALESDQVSVRATCRHDSIQNDIAVLTTVATGLPARNYIPLLMASKPQ